MEKAELGKKKLEDLRYIAKMMDIKSVTKFNKSALIDLILEEGNNIREKEEKKNQENVIEESNTSEIKKSQKRGRPKKEKKPKQVAKPMNYRKRMMMEFLQIYSNNR
jgi:transcription termination factor Rho